MISFTTVVPNLDRRPDRWYVCLGALLALGFPADSIVRFSAHDGNDYESYEHARNVALSQFPDSRYIASNSQDKHYYCWSWTWYDIMTQIVDGNFGQFTLMLVDDWMLKYTYSQISTHIFKLQELTNCIKLIMYQDSSVQPINTHHIKLTPEPKIPGLPFRRKISGSGDFANIITPIGAQEIITVADAADNRQTPNYVIWHVANTVDTSKHYFTNTLNQLFPLNRSQHTNNFEDNRQHDPTLIP